MSFFLSFETPVTVCRPFNTYGPRQSARAVIPTIITQIASGAKSIKLGAVHPTRDFNYVEDTAEGFIALAESEKTIGQTINLGNGYDISIGDTATTIAELVGKSITIETDEQRLRPAASEVERLQASNARAKELAGWTPAHGGPDGLKRGLKKTIEWFSDPANLKLYKADQYNV